jgi:hypothetical protein
MPQIFLSMFSIKTPSNKIPNVFTIDYRKGYNVAWTNNIKDYWP